MKIAAPPTARWLAPPVQGESPLSRCQRKCVGRGARAPLLLALWLGLLAAPSEALAVLSKGHRQPRGPAANISSLSALHPAAAAAPAPAKAEDAETIYPWAKCSTDPASPVVMDSDEECPPDCPFSQMVEGMSCEKLCVHASQCRQFHPVLFFPDIKTMRCTPSCGFEKEQHIAGCSECLGPGICKRCARGLFGIAQLEISDDGTRCVNVTTKWWYLFYGIAGIIILLLLVYVLVLSCREPENSKCEKNLQEAQARREEVRNELMNSHQQQADFLNTNLHDLRTASRRGGRGISLYFNWLLFGLFVAFTLAMGNFVAYELSDLGRHTHNPKSCMVRDPATHPHENLTMSTYVRPEWEPAEVHRQEKNSMLEEWGDWGQRVVEAVRASVVVVANEAPPTGSYAERYSQFHLRMFHAAITIYVIVVIGVLAMSVWQLAWVTARFSMKEPHARIFTAVVTGLPEDLYHGKKLTDYFRDVLKDQDLESLWTEHGGPRRAELENVPLKDRFWTVGTSLAYDFNQQKDDINKEIETWVYDLEMSLTSPDELRRPMSSSRQTQSQGNDHKPWVTTTSRGIQTETRGDISLQLRDEVPKHVNYPMFDDLLLNFTGLEEETEHTLHCSGTAFVVFSTEAARDAVVALARAKKLPRFTMPCKADADKSATRSYRLSVEPAHCEPVSVKWENFGPFSHFASKILLSAVMVFLTIFVWIALSLPSAIFIADLALIPGVTPGFIQNLILGLLIAIGNQLIAVVVNLVTNWMGFHYKDSRDVAVLGLAFMGTLIGTIFDLCVVAITAHGMVLEDAFHGRDAGYEPVVANEIFGLTVPGYLLLPYLGMPIGEHVIPYFLAKFLIRSHGKVTMRSATRALRSAEFDICWRYSDILNNTTICLVLLYFSSNRAWMVMSVLFLFLVVIYMIDKYLLLFVSTPAIYDTHRLSAAFAMWWCLPTTMMAGLISFWGYRSSSIPSVGLCFAIPVAHAFIYIAVLLLLENWLVQSPDKEPVLYPDMMKKLIDAGQPWDFFNTNPVYCLRTRCLGADDTGWREVVRFQRSGSSEYAVQGTGGSGSPNLGEKESDECLPFVRGSVRVLAPTLQKQAKQV